MIVSTLKIQLDKIISNFYIEIRGKLWKVKVLTNFVDFVVKSLKHFYQSIVIIALKFATTHLKEKEYKKYVLYVEKVLKLKSLKKELNLVLQNVAINTLGVKQLICQKVRIGKKQEEKLCDEMDLNVCFVEVKKIYWYTIKKVLLRVEAINTQILSLYVDLVTLRCIGKRSKIYG